MATDGNIKDKKKQYKQYIKGELNSEPFPPVEIISEDSLQENEGQLPNPPKRRQTPKKKVRTSLRQVLIGKISRDESVYDEHLDMLERVLNYYFPSDDESKNLAFILSLSYYMKDAKCIIISGELCDQLVDAILKLHPDNFSLIFDGKGEKDLATIHWTDIKLLWITNFKGNKELIQNKYFRISPKFTIRIKEKGVVLELVIPRITVISSTYSDKIPPEIKSKSIIIQLSNLKEQNEQFAEFYIKNLEDRILGEQRETEIKALITEMKTFLGSLDRTFDVEVPNIRVLKGLFFMEKSAFHFNNFVDIVKFITFFNQRKRNWYEFKESGKKYLIPHINDIVYALIITENLYTKPSVNLEQGKIDFFNYIVRILQDEKQRNDFMVEEDISITEIPFNQKDIILSYQTEIRKRKKIFLDTLPDSRIPARTTLINWLNEFSTDKLGILDRRQEKKNAKVYYCLKKVSFSNSFNYLEAIKKTIQIIDKRKKNLNSERQVIFHESISSSMGGQRLK